MNLSNVEPRSLMEWLQLYPPASATNDAIPTEFPIEPSSEVGPSGLSSEQKDTLPVSLSGTSSMAEASVSSPPVPSSGKSDATADEDIENGDEPDLGEEDEPETFEVNEPPVSGSEASLGATRKSLYCLTYSLLILFSRGSTPSVR